ncbi:MAG TPA: hypothetical protein VJZ00_25725 [Thermoanaerobaculia bacterium]|nr:hypothetical protein [Thermoanaerobaculia bacterium]
MRSVFVSVVVLLVLAPTALAQNGADLTVVKTGPDTALPGDTVTYNITVTNLGDEDATAPQLADNIPAGMTFVSETHDPAWSCSTPAVGAGGLITCNTATLAVGVNANFTFSFLIDPLTSPGTEFTNVATVSEPTDPNEENNSSTVVTSTPPPPSSDLGILKTGPSFAAAGSDVTFVLTFTNGGPDPAAGASFSDTLPGTMTFVSLTQTSGPPFPPCTTPAVGAGGTITCTTAVYPAGSSATFDLVANIPAGTVEGTSFSNVAMVLSDTSDPNSENDSAQTTVVVSTADVSVTKTGSTSVNAAADATYTITVTNAGPDTALDMTLTDNLPVGTTFVSFNQDTGPAGSCGLPAVGTNGTITCTWTTFPSVTSAQFTLVINSASSTSISNTATVATSSADPDTSNNSDTENTTVTQIADLSVTKTGPATGTAGTNITYPISIANAGPSTATSVSLTDTLPVNTTFVSVNQNTGPVFNCSGGPVVTCTIASLAPASTATFTVVAHINASAPNGSTLTNAVHIGSATMDTSSGNDDSSVNTTVTTSADLSVVKSGPTNATAGTDITYTISIANAGSSDAATVSLTDALPGFESFVSVTQNSGPTFNCTGAQTTTCTIASFANGASATFTLVGHIASATPNGTTLSNTANLTTATTDNNTSNNSSTVNTIVSPTADLSLTKNGPTTVAPGTDITYTISLANAGPSDATNVALTDTTPAGTTFVSMTQTSGPPFNCLTPATGATGLTTCTTPTLVAGASAGFTFAVHVDPTATGSITNTANVSSATPDPNPGNSFATSPPAAVVPATTDMSITKIANGDRFAPRAPVTYTITVTNNGAAVATNVVVTDELPAGATLTNASSTQGSCTGTTTVVCTMGVMLPAATATITLVAELPATYGPLVNTATVTSANADSDPSNNVATATVTTVSEIPALSPLALLLLAGMLALAGAFVTRM